MSLKRLVVTEQQLSEELLEKILSNLALLAQDTRRVILTPRGNRLPGRIRVLLVLAAQYAWRFVNSESDNRAILSLSLKEIEEQTGIAGGTLRPLLKALKDQHFVDARDRGVYQLLPHSLPLLASEIESLTQSAQDEQNESRLPTRRRRTPRTRPSSVRDQVRDWLEKSSLDIENVRPVIEANKLGDRYLVALHLAREQGGLPGLTPQEIVAILTEPPLNLPKIHASNVSRDLGRARKLVTPYKLGHAYEYRLTTFGDRRVLQLLRDGTIADG